jgi:hypothetical protein
VPLGPRLLLSALSTVLVAGVLTAAPATADPVTDPVTNAVTGAVSDTVTSSAREVAETALAQVEAAFAPQAADRRVSGAGSAGRTDLTMALRDLRIHQDDLAPADRARASALLNNRPPTTSGWTDPQQRDFGKVRIHWDAGTATNRWVNQVGGVVKHVLATYDKAGYRHPKSDGTRGGGTDIFDVYLDDLGPSYYGYCSTDQEPTDPGPYDTWAYCAFNTDYSWATEHTPIENLKVTAAHEIFHAVQFSYDYFEDLWMMEATAVWAEDEVYTSINDNRQYLQDSPISAPGRSLDLSTGMSVYGDWIFFRYLTERFPQASGGMPVLIRKIWEYADSVKGRDYYSIQAVAAALADKKLPLRTALAQFADANRRPAASYREGKNYPASKVRRQTTLSSTKRGGAWTTIRLDHLASSTVSFTPGAGLTSGWELKIDLDLPRRAVGAGAVVTVYRAKGAPQSRVVALGKRGDGSRTVKFGSRGVDHVELTMANAGTSYRCWQAAGTYSCHGRSQDDNRAMKYRAQVVRS